MFNLTKVRITGCYISICLICISILGLSLHGLQLGLDFTGGYVTEFTTNRSLDQQFMSQQMEENLRGEFRLNSSEGGARWTLRQAENDGEKIDSEWLRVFSEQLDTSIVMLDSTYIGSQVGQALFDQGGLALLVACVAIMLYLTLRFEWRLAMGSLVALLHDVLLVLGIFAWLKLSFDLTVLAAILAIIGYSLNDSIIVGDRIRELMGTNAKCSLETNIDMAIKSTLTRTFITSGTTLLTIAALWSLAGASLEGFSIALFSGVIVGSFSSITLSATVPQLIGLESDFYSRKDNEDKSALP